MQLRKIIFRPIKLVLVVTKIEQLCGRPLAAGLGDEPRRSMIVLWFDAAQGVHIGLTSQLSRAHYLLMLRWFLRARTRHEDPKLRIRRSLPPWRPNRSARPAPQQFIPLEMTRRVKSLVRARSGDVGFTPNSDRTERSARPELQGPC
jgi:hypothetical protein